MKISRRQPFLVVLTLVCLFLGGITNTANAQRGSGRLIIKRSADLGNDAYVDVTIDGTRAGGILWGQKYDRAVAPGPHFIAVKLGPTVYSYTGSGITVNVRPGATYRFVAVKRGGALALAPSG
jgi:hypothetical protein